jgi:hypothetical protein
MNFRIPRRKLLVKKLKKKKGSKIRNIKISKNNIKNDLDSTETPKSPIVVKNVKTVKKFNRGFDHIKKSFARKHAKSQVCSPIRNENIIVSGKMVNNRLANIQNFQIPESINTEKILIDEVEDEPFIEITDRLKAETSRTAEFIDQEDKCNERDNGNEKLESIKASTPEPIVKDETPLNILKFSIKSDENINDSNHDESVTINQASRSPELPVPLQPAPIDFKVKYFEKVNQSPLLKDTNKLITSIDRMNTTEELKSEGDHNLLSSSKKHLKKGDRKPSGHLLCQKTSLENGASIATLHHSSDKITAHFHSNRQKSVTSHDSPVLGRDTDLTRIMH